MSSPSLPTISLFTFAGLVILLACTFQSITPQTAQSIFVDGPGAPDADALIIGGSHAGLSGALTLVRHQHHIIVFDDGRPRNKWDTPMHVQPTWENQTPNQLRKASRQELRKSGLVKFVDEKIVKIDKHHDSLFYVTGSSGAQWSGRKLMLTPGVELVYPDIDGYTENFPDKILHCLFTRGLEFKGSLSAGVIAADLASSPSHAVILGDDAAKFAEIVTFYTNGDATLKGEIQAILSEKGEKDVIVDSRKITKIVRGPGSDNVTLTFANGKEKIESFLVHQPATKVNSDTVYQLGLETNGRGDIVTKMPFYETNVSGVFAAGDSASPFKMIPNAVFQGSNAGAGVARQLPRRVTGNKVDRVQSGGILSWIFL